MMPELFISLRLQVDVLASEDTALELVSLLPLEVGAADLGRCLYR